MSKSYYTYVLECADGTLYCGYTDDVERRVAVHNAGKGAKYTKPASRRPVKLLTAVKFPDKSLALKCEWWFKHKLTKVKKKDLIISSKKMRTQFEKYIKNR